jgi:hypothetical protein
LRGKRRVYASGARLVVIEGSFDARMARAAGLSAVAMPAAFLV